MAGKHSQVTKKSKAPVVIVISVAAVIVIAAAVLAFMFFNGAFSNNDNQQSETVPSTVSIAETSVAQTTAAPAETQASQSDTQSSDSGAQSSIVVPVEDDAEVTYFNATFIPNGTVVDTYTGKNTSLREVFGSGYNTEGVITFNSDGTFSETIDSNNPASGGYAVQNGKIIATYSTDKNMDITVTDWDGDTPAGFYINFAGYNVYFG